MSIIVLASCESGTETSQYMPVTTDSELALEFYEAGLLAYDQVKYELAYHSLNMAVEEDPNFFMAYFWLYFMTQKKENCIMEQAFYVEAELCDGEQQIQKALKYLVSGDNSNTVSHLKKAIELYPSDPHVHKILYLLQFHYLNDVEGAIATMKYAIDKVPDYDLVYNQLGYALMDLDEFEKAEEAFDNYINLSPDIANPYDSKGDFFMYQKRYQEAYDSYNRAYEIDSGFTVSRKKAQKAKQLMDN